MALLRRNQQPLEPSRRRPGSRPESSRRPQAFSYHASRSTRETNVGRDTLRDSEPVESKIQTRHWLIAVALLGLILLLSLQTPIPSVRLSGSPASRELLQNPAVYQAVAADTLQQSVLNRLKPLADGADVTNQLEFRFSELVEVRFTEPLIGFNPVVTVSASEPAFVISGNGGTFVVDQTGFARLAASGVSPAVRATLPTIDDQSGLPLAAGKAALPTDDVVFINQVLAQLKHAGVKWEGLTLPAGTSEVDVRISGQPYYVKFALRGGADARQQAGTYIAAKAKVGSQAKEYVDVRVPERLYYK